MEYLRWHCLLPESGRAVSIQETAGGKMDTMTREEMIEFLRGLDCRKKMLDEEKRRIRGCVETLQEAIYRNNFARHDDGSGIVAPGFSPDKVFWVLMNSERDIEVEARNMASQMKAVYEKEDQLDHVRRCLQKMDVQDQYILNEVYIKDNLVESLTGKMHYSRSHLYRMLQRAVDQLLDLYNSTCIQTGSFKADRLMEELRPLLQEGGCS